MGISNLHVYEVQGSIWDGFELSDDHIVPSPIREAVDLGSGQKDSCKKPWDGEISVTSNIYNTGEHFAHRKEDSKFPNLTRKDRMLERSYWSCTLDADLHPPCNDDTSKEVLSLPSNDTIRADPATEFCSDGVILNEACVSKGNNIYDYPLNHIPQADNQIGFFDNENGGKESSDLLYYGWPDIGNFEEVDRMFRSCDSTFGLESLQNEDESCSFPSSHNNEGSSISDSEKKNSTGSYSTVCQTIKVEAAPSEKSNLHKRRRYGNKSGGEDGYFENGGYLHPGYGPDDLVDAMHLSGNSSSLAYSSSSIEQRKYNEEHLLFACKQDDAAHQHSSFCHHPADQVSVFTTISSGLPENSGNPSTSAKGSSYSSNQMLSVDSGQGLSFNSPSLNNQYTGNLYFQEDLHAPLRGNYEHANFVRATTYYNQDCNQKIPYKFENEIEGHSGLEGICTGITREIDSTNAQDSSFTISVPDEEASSEAKSFRQLQQVMEKLDTRTKLCIRDGLYRLARSAEKRHECENLNDSIRHDMEVNRMLASEETNKCTGLMDMETDTNPIDRSIAHLLFHGPSDPSATAGAIDAYCFKSSPLIPLNSAIMAEKQVPMGETSSGADMKFVDELLD